MMRAAPGRAAAASRRDDSRAACRRGTDKSARATGSCAAHVRRGTHRLPHNDSVRHFGVETDAALRVMRIDVVHRLDVGDVACALARGA